MTNIHIYLHIYASQYLVPYTSYFLKESRLVLIVGEILTQMFMVIVV